MTKKTAATIIAEFLCWDLPDVTAQRYQPTVTCPKTCRECCGDGFVRRDEERPVRWRWSEAEGYDPTNTETCPRCGGDGYEPEDSTEENDQ